MLDELRRKIPESQLPVVEGDMATTRVEGLFSLVYVVWNSIGNVFNNAATQLNNASWRGGYLDADDRLRPGGVAAASMVSTSSRISRGFDK